MQLYLQNCFNLMTFLINFYISTWHYLENSVLGSPFLANQNWANLSNVDGRALCSLIGREIWKTNKKLWTVVEDQNLNDLEFFLNFGKLRQLISFIPDSSILLICVLNEIFLIQSNALLVLNWDQCFPKVQSI